MIYWITCCHMATRVMRESRARIEETILPRELTPVRGYLVDHLYPVEDCSAFIAQWAREWGMTLLKPEKNLGGHGGDNFALEQIKDLQDDDIIFIIDPDSYPKRRGWFTACVEALRADPTLGSVSLMPSWKVGFHNWQVEQTPLLPRVGFLPGVEMWNMCAFRGKVLRQGLLAKSQFYGYVEHAMLEHERKIGLRHGYLMDYWEDPNPEPHDEIYTRWKEAHAFGGDGRNFKEYVEARG